MLSHKLLPRGGEIWGAEYLCRSDQKYRKEQLKWGIME